jgi:twitching motility two-component system response regulator PilG
MSVKPQNCYFFEPERKLLADLPALPQLCCASQPLSAENDSFLYASYCSQRIIVQWLSAPRNQVRSNNTCGTGEKVDMSQEKNSTKGRVLLVDDDKIIRIKATKMLEQCGCDVTTAENGWDAVTQLEDVKPDLILLDITMEPMDGFKTLTLIRASRGEFRDTPVVMLSSHDDVFTMGKSKDRGCSAYLEKPLEMEALQQILQQFLAVREAS